MKSKSSLPLNRAAQGQATQHRQGRAQAPPVPCCQPLPLWAGPMSLGRPHSAPAFAANALSSYVKLPEPQSVLPETGGKHAVLTGCFED